VQVMRNAHLEEKCPFNASLDKCLPGVNIRFQRAEEQRKKLHSDFMEAIKIVHNNMMEGFKAVRRSDQMVPRMLGEALVETGTNMARASYGSPKRCLNELAALNDSPSFASNTSDARTSPLPMPNLDDPRMERPQLLEPTAGDPTLFRMNVKHGTLRSIWQEWFGLGPFEDAFGGVFGRNQNHTGWRKAAKIDNSLYSRHQRLIMAISNEAKHTQQQPEDVIDEWEALFQAANFVTGNLVVALQQLGKIPVRKSRGKTKKNDGGGEEGNEAEHQEQSGGTQ
jgi:Transcriptional activator of glycolytic enzymes